MPVLAPGTGASLWRPGDGMGGGRLFAWYDADDSSTLTLSGTSVTNWRDKSGNGMDVSTLVNSPAILKLSSGMYGVYYNRVGGLQSAKSASVAQPGMVVLAAYFDGLTTGGDAQYVLDGDATGRWAFGEGLVGAIGHKWQLYTSGATGFAGTSTNLGGAVWSLRFNTTASEIHRDGQRRDISTVAAATLGKITLGSYYGGAGYSTNGALCEVLYYAGIPSAQGQAMVENYLSHKWRLPLVLRPGNPPLVFQ